MEMSYFNWNARRGFTGKTYIGRNKKYVLHTRGSIRKIYPDRRNGMKSIKNEQEKILLVFCMKKMQGRNEI